jgi:hypothetical protein
MKIGFYPIITYFHISGAVVRNIFPGGAAEKVIYAFQFTVLDHCAPLALYLVVIYLTRS